ncbi:transposase [Novacetimonas pomaceti]|uniref:transposase n=1 Tax=Novacetimonas pomaceti TaxID=2021998 RepID=UPI001C2D3D88|nr:transposase [Novacetimonas pomaceti]
MADKGHNSNRIRKNLQFRDILPVIPPRLNRTKDVPCDFFRYLDRNRIERMFNRLKRCHRIATRYDKTKKSFPRRP